MSTRLISLFSTLMSGDLEQVHLQRFQVGNWRVLNVHLSAERICIRIIESQIYPAGILSSIPNSIAADSLQYKFRFIWCYSIQLAKVHKLL